MSINEWMKNGHTECPCERGCFCLHLRSLYPLTININVICILKYIPEKYILKVKKKKRDYKHIEISVNILYEFIINSSITLELLFLIISYLPHLVSM